MPVHQPQALEHEDAGASVEAELARRVPISPGALGAEEPRGDLLAHRREVSGEGAEVENVVVDGGRRHESAKAVPARDQTVSFQDLERLTQRHERDAEVLSEAPLGVEAFARPNAAGANPLTQDLRDLMVPGHSCSHVRSLTDPRGLDNGPALPTFAPPVSGVLGLWWPLNAVVELRAGFQQERSAVTATERIVTGETDPGQGALTRGYSPARRWESAIRPASFAAAAPESTDSAASATPSLKSCALPPTTRAAAAFISTMSRRGPAPAAST